MDRSGISPEWIRGTARGTRLSSAEASAWFACRTFLATVADCYGALARLFKITLLSRRVHDRKCLPVVRFSCFRKSRDPAAGLDQLMGGNEDFGQPGADHDHVWIR